MIRNFFKVTFRALVKNSVANTINILGLAIGIGCFLLIYINVNSELSYDTFHTDANQIYRITTIDEALGVSSNNVAITSPVLAKTAKEVLPEVIEAAPHSRVPRRPEKQDEHECIETNEVPVPVPVEEAVDEHTKSNEQENQV